MIESGLSLLLAASLSLTGAAGPSPAPTSEAEPGSAAEAAGPDAAAEAPSADPAGTAVAAEASAPAPAGATDANAESVAPATAPVPAPAPATAPAPGPAPVAAPSPAPMPAPVPVVAPVPDDPYTARMREIQADPDQRRRYRGGEQLVIAGAVIGGLGALTLLLVTLPAYDLMNNALEDADEARWVHDREQPLARARTRQRVMQISGIVGGAMTFTGATMMVVGISRRARMRRPAAATLSLAPAVGPSHWGAAAALRF